MARYGLPDTQAVYDAAAAFVDRCLRGDDSLFTPGRAIWSPPVLNDLHQRFVMHPDESSDRFEVKLQRQLAGAPAETVQLMAECLYVYFLIANSVRADTKSGLIETVLGWSPAPSTIPSDLVKALSAGVASGGIDYNTRRPFHLTFLIDFARAWKSSSNEDRRRMLEDPWAFRDFVLGLPFHLASSMRNVILHLVHPDSFERITWQEAKGRICDTFRDLVTDTTLDVDRQLYDIRSHLVERLGRSDVDFWDPDLLPRWQPESSKWGQFIHWAGRFLMLPDFEARERDYKYRIAGNLERARSALLDGTSWQDFLVRLKDGFGSPNNITYHITHSKFQAWAEEHPDDARVALHAIWDGGKLVDARIRDFCTRLPKSVIGGLGTRLNLAAFLNMVHDVEQNPPYRVTSFVKAYELTGYPPPPPDADEAATYRHALEFLERIGQEAERLGITVRDPLDAQSVVWDITAWKREALKEWSPQDRRAFLRFRGEAVEGPDDEEVAFLPGHVAPDPTAAVLSQAGV